MRLASCLVLLAGGLMPAAASAQEGTKPLELHSRTVHLEPGIDPQIVAGAEGAASVHVIARLRPGAGQQDWSGWQESGIHWAAYLQDSTWILRIDLRDDAAAGLEEAFSLTGALSFAALLPEDRAPASLLEMQDLEPWAFEEDTGRLRVVASFFRDTDEATLEESLARHEVTETFSPLRHALLLSPDELVDLLTVDAIEWIEPGPPPALPLMELTRGATGADALQGFDGGTEPPTYGGFSGDQVRVSNSEGLNANHDDFWNHDANGNRTTQRWLGCPNGNGAHGTMTAGIILGSGFQSSRLGGGGEPNGGAPYAYRGMAPEALFDCYGSSPDLSNHSFTQSHSYGGAAQNWDDKMWGGVPGFYHLHIGAAGNEGMNHQYGNPDDRAYYSTWRNSKNELVVGMLSDDNFKWTGSSIGPSLDGRLKPEISAPSNRHFFPGDREEVAFEIDYVRLRKNGLVESQYAWDFDGTASWKQGWTEIGWWDKRHVGPVTQANLGGGNGALRSTVSAAKTHWALVGTTFQQDGQTALNLSSHPSHQLEIRYRYDSVDRWNNLGARARLGWTVVEPGTNDYTDWFAYHWDLFPIITDGAWHVATVDIGAHPEWSTAPNEVIDILQIYPVRASGRIMRSPGMDQNYQGSGGSSAAAPVVTGAAALLLDQMKDDFGATLGSATKSPFWNDTLGGGTGMPLPSTLRALLVHGARDLAIQPRASDLDNPDTLEPTRYFKGPDEVTGYGIVDVGESSRVLAAHSFGSKRLVEWELLPGVTETLNLAVPAGQPQPLKVTLAWDDPPGSPFLAQNVCRLVNDLDLRLRSPSNVIYEPWDLDSPAYYQQIGQTLPSEVRPAVRRDNDCDNLEQVYVETPEPGIWTVEVKSKAINGPAPPQGCWEYPGAPTCQRYSLILGSPPRPHDNLYGGKVVFTSDRAVNQPGVHPRQLFVQEVVPQGQPQPTPQQLTFEESPARFPEWSHDGQFIAYVTHDVLSGSNLLRIIDTAGTVQQTFFPGDLLGTSLVLHPSWSRDGRRLVFTHGDTWGGRALGVLEFAAPYDFQSSTAYSLVAPGMGAMDGVFSPDGATVYFDAQTGNLYKVPSGGGTPVRLYGDGEPMKRSFDLSISPDGHSLLMNSELYKDGLPSHLDEEVVELQLREAVTYQRTRMDGHQYASYALGGHGEFVSQSTSNVGGGGKRDLYLQENGHREKLFIDDASNVWNDDDPHWFKNPAHGFSLPSVKSFCRDAESVVLKAEICNFDSEPHSYEYSLSGINAGSGCDLAGPTDFTYLDPDPVTVAANSCIEVRVRVERPPGMNAQGLTSCYQARSTNVDNGVEVTDRGVLRDARNQCAVISGGGGGIFGVGTPQIQSARLTDTSGKGGTLKYRWRVEGPAEGERYDLVSLDRQPPGTDVVGAVSLKPEASVELPVEVTFTEADPLGRYELVFELDTDGDGELEPQASTGMRTKAAGDAPKGLELTLHGACDDEVIVHVEGARPGGRVALYAADREGRSWLEEGSCADAGLDLEGASRLTTLSAGAGGEVALPRKTRAAQCDLHLQAIDLATCLVSDVKRLESTTRGE